MGRSIHNTSEDLRKPITVYFSHSKCEDDFDMSRLIDAADVTSNTISSRIDFQREKAGAVSTRFITLDGKKAHYLGLSCGTCGFIFERQEGANSKVSPATASESLRSGVSSIRNPITEASIEVLPSGRYKALLVTCVPQLIIPSKPGDYFFEEQLELWGIDPFWGMPHYAKNEYYRTHLADISDQGRLFEFIVPMFPRRYLREDTIQSYKALFVSQTIPTALAVSILDVKQPATWVGNPEITSHWCLAHYLLDGHHKVYAASQAHKPISLLSFLAIEKGISSAEQIAEVLKTLAEV